MSIVVLVVGQYPLKYIIRLGAIAVVGITMFLFVALNTNTFKNTRVHTWISRVETFVSSDKLNESENEALKAKNYHKNIGFSVSPYLKNLATGYKILDVCRKKFIYAIIC